MQTWDSSLLDESLSLSIIRGEAEKGIFNSAEGTEKKKEKRLTPKGVSYREGLVWGYCLV
jgi:hypothetical protein